jgi:hypothetical protein
MYEAGNTKLINCGVPRKGGRPSPIGADVSYVDRSATLDSGMPHFFMLML